MFCMLENIPNTKMYSLPLLVFYCCITNDHSYLHIGTTFNISHFLWIWHVLTESSAQGLIKAEIKVSIYLHPHMVVWLGKDPLPSSFNCWQNFLPYSPRTKAFILGLSLKVRVWQKELLSVWEAALGSQPHGTLHR